MSGKVVLKRAFGVPGWVWLAACWAFGGLALAEEEAAAVPSGVNVVASGLEGARAKLEASELDAALKAPIRERLDRAGERLDEAERNRQRAEELDRLLEEAPARTESLTKELAEMPAVDAIEVEMPAGVEDLRIAVEQTRATVARLEREFAARERERADLQALPLQINARLPAANAELAQARTEVAALGMLDESSLKRLAEQLLTKAELEALRAEVDRLEGERLGLPLREELVGLEHRLVERRLETEQERLKRMEAALEERLVSEVDWIREKVEGLVDPAVPELAEVVEGLERMVESLEHQSEYLTEVAARADEMRDDWDRLRRDNESIRRQIRLSGLEGAFTQVMLEQLQKLPNRRGLDYDLKQLNEELSRAQLEDLRIEEKQGEQRSLEARWADESSAAPILELRATLLGRLGSGQRALVRDLARLGADKTAYRDLSVEMGKFLSEQLFWRRSSDPIDLRFFRSLPRSVGVLLSPEPWRELTAALAAMPKRHPVAVTMVSLLLVVLVIVRPRLRRSIEASGSRIRLISTDRLIHTLRALLQTFLLALPVPLALGFLSWSLASEPGADPWVRGFGLWLGWSASALLWICSLYELAREGGVGLVHLGWDAGVGRLLTRWLPRLAAVYFSALLLATATLFDSQSHAFDSVGRFGFIVGQAGLAWVLAGIFRPDTGVFGTLVGDRRDLLMVKWRGLWFGMFAGIPLVLAVMGIAGYTLTAFFLGEQFFFILRWIVVGVVVYGVGVRFFMIKERRLALAEAIAERHARREAAEKGDEEGEETVTLDDDEIELGLDAVSRQTRRLLRSLVGVGVVMVIAYGVAKALPIEQAGNFVIIGQLTWVGLLKALLIGAVTFTCVKNLPGLLDMLGLRQSGMEAGTRYALATLCQYFLAAVGIFFVATALDLEWARLSWIAAALSVGLGFGLQEIVANFVCGIILLFERPIRVGDVVTVGEVTGTVSRIRMRATTITNWERQEFVVPNKEFITGSLINWTLSSPLNRITLSVGVAYGSDTVEARRILAEIAEAHPVVLQDPAPLVTFEAFADSTLNLGMRCYLPNMDNRMKTMTELHEEIDRRFKEAGIEIAFPQRDLHVRTVPDELIRGKGPETGVS